MLEKNIYIDIKKLLLQARNQIVKSVNSTMVYTYFEIWKIIVENQQLWQERALYWKETLKNLSIKLTKDFWKGFSVQNIERMRKFYLSFWKSSTLSRKFELSWSHYLILMRLDEKERNFYEKEAIINNWSLRELQRQFDSALYERIVLSRDKKWVLEDNLKKYHSPENPKDILKDPYILEFLWIKESIQYSETELEQAIIDKLEHFLLELGKWFTFVGRQQRFSFD